MTQKNFVPLSEIRKLANGSYEQVIAGLGEAAQASAKTLFGEEIACEVVGTFPDSVLVLGENGRIVRAKWERTEAGEPKIVRHEEVSVPRYSEENVEDYVRLEVRKAVKAWQAGRVAEAKAIISEVAPYVGDRVPLSDSKAVSLLAVEFKALRPWRALLQAKSDRIRPLVGEGTVRRIEAARAEPKYTLLYNGSLSESEVRSYRDLVEADFGYLTTRVAELRDLVQSSYESVGSVVRSDELQEEEAITTFVTFSEDLISDLTRVHQVVSEAAKKISKLESLSQLFDVINEGWVDYEVGGRFVKVMSDRLIEAVKVK